MEDQPPSPLLYIQIEAENRLATQEEQTVLSKFVGWGGLSQAFDENNAAWSKEYAELKDIMFFMMKMLPTAKAGGWSSICRKAAES